MLTAMTTRGFLPLFREKMVMLEHRRSVVFCVSAAVPAPQQLQGRRSRVADVLRERSLRGSGRQRPGHLLDVWSNVVDLCTHLVSDHVAGGGSRICSQHHPVLQQMNTHLQPLINLKVFTLFENKQALLKNNTGTFVGEKLLTE